MSWLTLTLAWCGTMVITLILTGWLKKISITNNWFDWPTDRGSHVDPVPNIGGLAMTLVLLGVIVLLLLTGYLSPSSAVAWLFSLSLLGLVGFIDDIRDLSTRFRLLVHCIVAIVVVYAVGGIHQLDTGLSVIPLQPISYLLGLIWVVGFINMYNFMDGINGLAGSQALIAGLVFGVWYILLGQQGEGAVLLAVAAVSAGFLYWNITPARVFMGDCGSTVLGAVFAIASLDLHNSHHVSIIFPALVFAWFLLDTSVTLVKRLIKGEKIWQAHRQHLYQRLASRPEDHIKVTGMISLLTLIISITITIVLFKQ